MPAGKFKKLFFKIYPPVFLNFKFSDFTGKL